MASHTQTDERFWQLAVLRFSRRIHLGWWMDAFFSLLIPFALTAVIAILALRWWLDLPLKPTLTAIGGGTLLVMLAAYGRMRRLREPLAATQVRLEDALQLKTRLTAAAAGVGAWPAKRENLPLPVVFRSGRPVIMTGCCIALLQAALWVPISRHTPTPARVIEPPSALQEVQNWLDNLKKEDAASEDSIKEVEQKMAELLQRPAQNWYEHASLEAADHLRDLTAQDLQQFAQNLADAERAANALAAASAGQGLPQAAKDALSQQIQQAAQAMQAGGIQPNTDLADALKSLDPEQLANMSSEQLKDLAKQLSQNTLALSEALKNSPTLDLSKFPEGRPGQCDGNCNGQCDGNCKGKDGPGRGGITRGPGTAPVTLDAQDTQLGTDKVETLKSPLDLQRVATGDALSVTDGAAKIDPNSYQGTQQGGSVSNPGDGGNAVWQNTLLPTERETLKRFFK